MRKMFTTKNVYFRVYLAVFLVFISVTIGISGYMIIEKFSFTDALYMAMITISTIGFGEVRELSNDGKIFTIFFIIICLSTFTFSVTVITRYIADGEFRKRLKSIRMKKSIDQLKDHVIVCGFGRNGSKCCEELFKNKTEFVVIESKEETFEKLSEKNYYGVFGDATEDKILQEANIMQAKALITTLPIDADNLFVVLTANKINPKLIITSRSSSESNSDKLRIAGANHVVMPESIGGHYMANLISRPDLIEFYHLLTENVESSVCTEEFDFDSFKSEFQNTAISAINFRKLTGVNIIAFKDKSGKFVINPDPETILIKGTKLIALGTRTQIDEMKRQFLN